MNEVAVATKRVDVVVILISKKNDYQLLQEEDAEATIHELGLTCRVLFADNPFDQLELIFQECTRPDDGIRPSGLVIEPVGSKNSEDFRSFRRALTTVQKRGILVGVINQKIEGLDPDVLVTSDPRATGLLQAQQCVELLPEGGNVFVIGGPNGAMAADGRLEALREGLRGTNVKIAGDPLRLPTWDGGGYVEKIKKSLESFNTLGVQVHMLAGQNDSLAIAGRMALGDSAIIPVIGIDGTPEFGQKQVDGRIMTATIVTLPATGKAIRQLNHKLKKGSCEPNVLLKPESYPDLDTLKFRRK